MWKQQQQQTIRRSVAAVGVAVVTTPALLSYYLFEQHQNRDISEEEVILSQRHMKRLATVVGATSIHTNTNTNTNTSNDGANDSNKKKGINQNCNQNDHQHHHHQHHLRNLIDKGGVTVLPKQLNSQEVATWNNYLQDAFSNNNNDNNNNNNNNNNNDNKYNNKYNKIVSNQGRYHSHQQYKQSKYNSQFLSLLNDKIPKSTVSIIQSYFSHYSTTTKSSQSSQSSQTTQTTKYKLTQVQFLNAIPGSNHQIWHRDNIFPGLTLLIALDDVGCNGPTELLVGSHHNGNDDDHSIHKYNGNDHGKGSCNSDHDCINDDCDSTMKMDVILACLSAGDALLYDARVLHRGRGYSKSHGNRNENDNDNDNNNDNNKDSDRPVLILRWDALSTPPPGGGLIVTNLNGWLGSYHSFMVWIKDMIQ